MVIPLLMGGFWHLARWTAGSLYALHAPGDCVPSDRWPADTVCVPEPCRRVWRGNPSSHIGWRLRGSPIMAKDVPELYVLSID